MYPRSQRLHIVRNRIFHMAIHSLLILYITALIWAFWDSWAVNCIRRLNIWLSIYLVIELAHLCERWATACSWLSANDPKLAESKLFIYGRLWLYLIESAWVLYGSTFIYSDEID